MINKRIILSVALAVIVICGVITFAWMRQNQWNFSAPIPISQFEEHARAYDGKIVIVEGVVIENIGLLAFGPRYQIADGGQADIHSASKIAIGGKEKDTRVQRFVAYEYDGSAYRPLGEQKSARVKGIMRYVGEATDSPPYYIDIQEIGM